VTGKCLIYLHFNKKINFFEDIYIGVVIGCGWQVMVGYINLACYYIVGLPIGIFLGFNQHLGVKV
jgi:MATE family multidrug resistance protein